ncbi:cyanophycin metabolism-associated DUF1854 family protein [Chitinimonas sp. BJB300]|uniref:cyanophycin metabolism-associated DUF1854 family protein n=1 Tax=Chitinimonas sp. BJB300 TaxID=1559339 RepID=UPI000C0E93C7|nr:DUF1854 domain-containing protein [Chitinimonas sp. BJB300]PHV12260.1 hypothetical protein CSQ89_06630 [Chitinimonas sp. BJB300]TSJ84771.1 DUF1854 domain-containing protein [Chitinimonas sp. BJB300]
MTQPKFQLQRNAFGRLVLESADAGRYEGVVPVRAFPVADPGAGISLINTDGHEVGWVDRLSDLPESQRLLIEEELASREFMPQLQQLIAVSSFATPSTWTVRTDRGPTTLVLKGEEDIRRLGRDGLLVLDSHGIQFLIRDLSKLDKTSRRLLDRFL